MVSPRTPSVQQLISGSMTWLASVDDPELLSEEIRTWQVERDLLESDVLAGDFSTPGGLPALLNGIDYADAVLERLFRQADRLTRGVLSPPPHPLTDFR